MGIVISGSACGGMIRQPVLRAITSHIGFGNVLRISGSLVIFFVPLAGFTLRWEPNFKTKVRGQTAGISRKTGWINVPLVNWRVAKSKKFVSQALGASCSHLDMQPHFSSTRPSRGDWGYSESMADNFITIGNAANFVLALSLDIWLTSMFD
jgi:hypothetical protein